MNSYRNDGGGARHVSARRPTRSSLIAIVASCATLAVHARRARAQTPGWHSTLEANASSLFGATSQTLMSLAANASHDGAAFSADAGVSMRYGESEDADGVKFVNARGVAAQVAVDGTPKARFSPFLLASVETSLEKRIANRRSAGLGAKWSFVSEPARSASISLALLGERTAALSDTAVAPVRVARWSWRVKFGQKIHDRLTFSHVTFYAPLVDSPSQYTIASTSVASYAINSAVAFTFTLTDNYDSQARARGAPSNNDGALLFGVRGMFK